MKLEEKENEEEKKKMKQKRIPIRKEKNVY